MAPKQSKNIAPKIDSVTRGDGTVINGDDYILQIIMAEDLQEAISGMALSSTDCVITHMRDIRDKIDKAIGAVKKYAKDNTKEGRELAKKEKEEARREAVKLNRKEKREALLELDIILKKFNQHLIVYVMAGTTIGELKRVILREWNHAFPSQSIPHTRASKMALKANGSFLDSARKTLAGADIKSGCSLEALFPDDISEDDKDKDEEGIKLGEELETDESDVSDVSDGDDDQV